MINVFPKGSATRPPLNWRNGGPELLTRILLSVRRMFSETLAWNLYFKEAIRVRFLWREDGRKHQAKEQIEKSFLLPSHLKRNISSFLPERNMINVACTLQWSEHGLCQQAIVIIEMYRLSYKIRPSKRRILNFAPKYSLLYIQKLEPCHDIKLQN